MTPIIAVVGRSGVGKTSLLERLIPELRERGYRVGCIKHTHHDFAVDYPGKDSWRVAQAGSDWVAIANHKRLAVMAQVEDEPSPDVLVAHFNAAVDIVLTEGFRNAGTPCIEVMRAACSSTPLLPLNYPIAIVTDVALRAPCPVFAPHDIAQIADLIERRYL